ncbi:MAG: sirohydrochlorin cobaltochelatase [Desulfococcus sp.]|nr:MAG: sirohydrochlorin cobaltochelatase [Desulfococcus sp.]
MKPGEGRLAPIVMAAFGTTRQAMATYSFIHEACVRRFPGHPVYWAFSSRVVKEVRNQEGGNLRHPDEVLRELADQGHEWAVVQSLHLMCGHEFYRMVDTVLSAPLRCSVGLPLLHCPADYQAVVDVIMRDCDLYRNGPCRPEGAPENSSDAVVLVGHGTDHPSWCSYVALDHIFRGRGAKGLYVGVVEQGYPKMADVIREVRAAGYRRVRLVPFLLVAGMHFEEDLSGKRNSWKTGFEDAGIDVSLEDRGIGLNPGVVDIFCRHIADALALVS